MPTNLIPVNLRHENVCKYNIGRDFPESFNRFLTIAHRHDFDAFVARTRELGMEVALDYALQASPDHPWAKEHPDWFTTRADGSIAYAVSRRA